MIGWLADAGLSDQTTLGVFSFAALSVPFLPADRQLADLNHLFDRSFRRSDQIALEFRTDPQLRSRLRPRQSGSPAAARGWFKTASVSFKLP